VPDGSYAPFPIDRRAANPAEVLLCLFLVACAAACGGRTMGSAPDGAFIECPGGCLDPLGCDSSTGLCECPAATCCFSVDCSCSQGEQHCDGADLTGCEERLVQFEDGKCGTVCEHPVIETCAELCFEPSPGGARCAAAGACELAPNDRYDFHVSTNDGSVFGCGVLTAENNLAAFSLTGTLNYSDGVISIASPSGLVATTEHNLPWHPWSTGDCSPGTPDITVTAEFRLSGDSYCVRKLALQSPNRLMLLAQDGGLAIAPDLTVAVRLLDIGCPPGPGGPCGPSQVFALEFTFGSDKLVAVEQNSGDVVKVDGEHYDVYNLRSFDAGDCTEEWNRAFFLAQNCYWDP
jgi:hypothetical protein